MAQGLTLLCAVCAVAIAQTNALRGTVEQVDVKSKRVSVTNEPIPGGMGAMTMSYKLDDNAVLNRLKKGDRITAKFTEGDLTLHDVRIEGGPKSAAQPGLTLEELQRMALANNPTIAQARASVEVAQGAAKQSGLYPNPTVGYYGDEIRGGYYAGGKQGGFVSQTIVTAGKLGAARRVGALIANEAETSGEAQRQRIVNDVSRMFYQVLGEQRLVDVRRDLVKLATDAAETSHQLANIGQADRPDVLQAEVEQQGAVVGLRVAEQTLQSSWRTLVAVVGKPDLPQSRVAGELEAIPELTYDDSLAATLTSSPQMKLAQQEIARSQAALDQARKAPIPDLQLSANLSQNNEPLETSKKTTGLNGGVQIGVQLPIFNRNQGNIAAAKAEAEKARQEVTRLKLQFARDLANEFRDYESARTTVQLYKEEMLPRAKQAYQLYQASYQKMAAAYPQVLTAQRTLFQLEVDYVQALEKAWQAALGIRGFGLMDGLAMCRSC